MKRKFVSVDGQRVIINFELREINSKIELSMNGDILNEDGKLICCGQCQESIMDLQFEEDDQKTVNEMIEIWNRWHLNGMRPGCEHQRDWKWDELVTTRTLIINTNRTFNKNYKSSLDKFLISYNNDAVVKGNTRLTMEAQSRLFELEKIINNIKEILKTKEYIPDETTQDLFDNGILKIREKTEMSNYTRNSDNESGLLGKPCPVCGYKYGSEWLYEEIPDDILNKIKNW